MRAGCPISVGDLHGHELVRLVSALPTNHPKTGARRSLDVLYPLFLVVWLGGGPVATALWALDRLRARRRNARGECALCGQSWPSAARDDRYLIQGRLVCSVCALRAKHRMAWQFGILVGAATFATSQILQTGSPVVLIALPIVSVFGGMAGALKIMKLANRRAQSSLPGGAHAPHALR